MRWDDIHVKERIVERAVNARSIININRKNDVILSICSSVHTSICSSVFKLFGRIFHLLLCQHPVTGRILVPVHNSRNNASRNINFNVNMKNLRNTFSTTTIQKRKWSRVSLFKWADFVHHKTPYYFYNLICLRF